jgi:hypothetical protein
VNSYSHPNDPQAADVLDALRESLDDVTMGTPVDRIESVARTRMWRRRLTGTVVTCAAVTGLVIAGQGYGNPSTAPPQGHASSGTQDVHILTAAYSVDSQPDGTVHVTWDKQKLFEDHVGLESALHQAGFPVLIKVGEFCKGPHDTGGLESGGVGAGVDRVMKGERESDGKVTFVFTPSAMPAGTQLFIGYLNPAQLAVTGGRPGSVERLVPTAGTLDCTTQLPTVHG